ncbi:pyridoxal-phosphate dependent enzyme [Fulvivirga ulvae]|uniref:pyridoxal-phosphate dependent enzyme n=1 Tax=Fulvivirga ulvae TaxID=2904245 RepID=UPI001F342FC1|nr:pyridoxal-phosphate dependent enzyme [Fulvivirga ulvae]UII33060.1 pyridoxal-phosphate dependent enzyme [Fulvivirga ulvae]
MRHPIHKEDSETDSAKATTALPHTSIAFEKRCLYCGELNNSINYTCNCKFEDWFKEYRILDIQPLVTPIYRREVIKSFRNYSFTHQQGIAQYKALPFREWYPEHLEPIGMTPLHYLKNLSSLYGARIYIKNEGNNPSGCFKDRETLLALLNTRRRGLRHAVIYSSGNAAASAAILAQKQDIQLITFVAGDTYPEKIEFIREHGSDVIVVGDENTNFETGFRLFARVNAENIFSRSKFDNWSVRNPYRVHGDKTTALEIVKQFSDNPLVCQVPDYIIVPTANGSCLAGIWKGFRELKQLNIISKLPKIVSVGIKGANPVFKAVRRKQTGRPERCDLSLLNTEDANIGSTILAEEGYDSIEAAKAVISSDGIAVEVNSEDIQNTLRDFLQQERQLAGEQAVLPEPASLISIAAIKKIKCIQPENTVVSIITGHGLKAKEMIDQLLSGYPDLQHLVADIIKKKQHDISLGSITKGRRRDVAADFDAVVNVFNELKR